MPSANSIPGQDEQNLAVTALPAQTISDMPLLMYPPLEILSASLMTASSLSFSW